MINPSAPEPIKISWSALRTHAECRQKSHLLRSGKRARLQNLRGYYHGMVVDKAMVDWLADPHRAPGEMAARIDDLIDSVAEEARATGDGIVRWRGSDDRQYLRDFCVELVVKLEPLLRQHVLPYPHQIRKRFTVPVSMPYLDGSKATVLLTGEMDLLVEDQGWVVWDLKGTQDNSYWRKVLGQLVFYDLAVLCLYHTPTRLTGLIQPMCRQPLMRFPINQQLRTVMWTRIQAMANDIWRANHACKTDTSGCSWCEVKHACARFGETSTLAASLRAAATDLRTESKP